MNTGLRVAHNVIMIGQYFGRFSMRVYLDICCLNRPFDDARQLRIHLESEAVLGIISAREQGQIEIVSSDALAHENDLNPNPDRRRHVRSDLEKCSITAKMDQSVILNAANL